MQFGCKCVSLYCRNGLKKYLFMEKEFVLYIKNMVCNRCIWVVQELLRELQVPYLRVELGQVVLSAPLSESMRKELAQRLEQHGFLLLADRKEQLVALIRSAIIRIVRSEKIQEDQNLSAVLTETCHMDYSALSKLFSEQTSVTVEQYYILQKVERVKELLSYGELTLAEIADRVHYSSQAHLCAQFKKITGMTPTQYRKQKNHPRSPLDEV